MNLVAKHLFEDSSKLAGVHAELVGPSYRRFYTKLPLLGGLRLAVNADRFFNRMRHYPNALAKLKDKFDVFHICDHAYANLVHALPPERTGVYCHDLDTFACLFDPQTSRRPRWFRNMMRRVLEGMQNAAIVFHSTLEIRRQILAHKLIDERRLIQVYYGVEPRFNPTTPEDDPAASFLAPLKGRPFIYHAGNNLPRKRLDVLIKVFAGLRARYPELQLVQTGADLSKISVAELDALRNAGVVHALGFVPREVQPSLYRRAALVLVPSDAEGFCFPVIEALACGTPLVASDIPTLRESGGNAATFCPVANIDAWVEACSRILADPSVAPPKEVRLAHAARFTWAAHAEKIVQAYQRMQT